MKRPKLRKRDRVFWVWLFGLWSGWRWCLMIVRPETGTRKLRASSAATVASEPFSTASGLAPSSPSHRARHTIHLSKHDG